MDGPRFEWRTARGLNELLRRGVEFRVYHSVVVYDAPLTLVCIGEAQNEFADGWDAAVAMIGAASSVSRIGADGGADDDDDDADDDADAG